MPASSTAVPKSTLIICSSGRPKMLAEVVHQVVAGEVVPTEFLVVENANGQSSPLSTFTTHRCNFRYMPTSATTLSEKRNLALASVSHELIVICDDDVSVPVNWFRNIALAAVRAGPNTIVTGRVLPGPEEVPGAFAPSLHPSSVPAVYGRRTTLEDPLATFNCAFYRSVYERIGEFDIRLGPGTGFPSCEDNDFGLRALESDLNIAFEPEAVLYHRAWRAPQDFVKLRWRYGLGQGAFYAKHLGSDAFIWRKLLAAWTRHARRATPLGYRTSIGEMAWFAGFAYGLPTWIIKHRATSGLHRGPLERTEPPP
jgi:GT2 family glycosyltransferase